jgi:molybdate transport system substrate-binding protein
MRALADSKSRQPIGCTQATEILATPGVVLVSPLPTGCELATAYTAAIVTKSRVPAEAAELIALLTGDAGRDSRERLGFV